MPIVLIDAGNSAVKWRLESEGCSDVLTEHYRSAYDQLSLLQKHSALCTKAVLSVVCTKAQQNKLQRVLPAGISQHTVTIPEPSPIHITYRPPLGIDRYLAMYAVHQHAPVLVVDAGTTITVDYVDEAHAHIGGWIVPGLHLAYQAVLQGTAIPAQATAAFDSTWGTNTEQAIAHGVFSQTVAWLDALAAQYPAASKWLTGHDAHQLLPLLSRAWHSSPTLVLDGLSRLYSRA